MHSLAALHAMPGKAICKAKEAGGAHPRFDGDLVRDTWTGDQSVQDQNTWRRSHFKLNRHSKCEDGGLDEEKAVAEM